MAGVSAIANVTWVAPNGSTGTFTLTQGVSPSIPAGSRLTFALATSAGVAVWSVNFWSDDFALKDGGHAEGRGFQSLALTLPVAVALMTIEVQAVGENGGRDVITSATFSDYELGPPAAWKVVRVRNGGGGNTVASPYTANVFDTCEAVTDNGDVAVSLPGLALGQWVRVKHDPYTSLSAANVNVTGPAGIKLAQPPPNNANNFVSTQTFTGNQSAGFSLTWANTGSAGGYTLG